jgi:hypothetical protein
VSSFLPYLSLLHFSLILAFSLLNSLIFLCEYRVVYWDSDASVTAKMLNEEYTAVPLDEKDYFSGPHVVRREYPVGDILKAVLVVFFIAIGSFTLGFGVSQKWKEGSRWETDEDGLLPPQAFVPDSMCFVSKVEIGWLLMKSSPDEGSGI